MRAPRRCGSATTPTSTLGWPVRCSSSLTALVETCPATQAASGQGALSAAHARVITEVVAKLPVHAGSLTVAQAEVFLVEQAALLCPRDLAGVGRELHERIAGDFPSVDDPAEAAAMEAAADEAASGACERRGLDVYERPGGEVGTTGSLAGDDAAALVTWLDAASQPDAADDGVVDERTATQRRADALGLPGVRHVGRRGRVGTG